MHPDHDSTDQTPTHALPRLRTETPPQTDTLNPGERFGHYRIDGLLGRGGMGEVYRAEQLEPVRRTVALKLARAQRLDTRHLVWFEIERQMLARMQHPAIAQIYDAGTTAEGHPYFAMEYIEGQPITTYCEAKQAGLRERIALMIGICEGVQHAHQRGVIHRDLKPGNLLVHDVDGRGVPKIIDFGIATAARRSGGEREYVGTPDYMSPEQAGALEIDIDTRSDVYSLGVVLCELLVEQRPANIGATTAPTLPSRAFAQWPSERQDSLAATRGFDRRRFDGVLRDELDWVVGKAIARDRDTRYASASALADDLRRFLEAQPLQAVPPTRRYRFGKFMRRHRLAFAAATAVTVAVFGGLGLSLYGLWQAREQRAVAEARRQELEQVVAFQQSMLEGIDIAQMGQSLARGASAAADGENGGGSNWTDLARETLDAQLLDRALATIDRDFATRPALAADLRESVADVQLALGLYERASEVYAATLQAREAVLGERDPKTLHAMRMNADAVIRDGRAAQAQPLIERAVRLAAQALPQTDPERMRIEQTQAAAQFDLGELEAAESRLRALHARAKAAHGENHELSHSILGQWADVRLRLGEIKPARAAYESMYAYQRKHYGEQDPRTEALMAKLAPARGMDNDYDGSLALTDALIARTRERLGAEHPDTLGQINTRVVTLIKAGRMDDARASLDGLVASATRVLGATHPRTLRYLQNQASLSARMRDFGRAVTLQRTLLAARRQALGIDHPDTLLSQVSLATILADAGRLAEAVDVGDDGCRRMVAAVGEAHPNTSGCHYQVGTMLLDLDRTAAAAPMLERALKAQHAKDGATSVNTVETALALHDAYHALGRAAQRAQLHKTYFDPLLALAEETLDPRQKSLREEVRAALAQK